LGARQNARAETLDDTSAIVLDIRRTGTIRAMTERPLTIPTALHKGDSVDEWQLLRAFQGTDRVWLAEKDGQRAVLKFAPAEALFSVSSRAGTASYLAPERFHGAPLSERTEIFAMGVTLYQALTGRLPYGEIERFQTPTFTAPRRPSKWNPNIPPWLDAVVM